MIRLILVAVFLILFLILSIPVMLVEWLLGKSNPDAKSRSSLAIVNWAFRCVRFLAGVKVDYIGEENIPTDTPVLYIGNHRSYFEIVLTFNSPCSAPHRLYRKEEYGKGAPAQYLDAQSPLSVSRP